MWLNYTDREVDSYHPVCETILNNALINLGLQNIYRVEHHRMVGSLEMDFVISNIETSKILCVIEVKRTIEAVLSTRYQLQAMSYVQELRPSEKEKEYYVLTNLEAVALFKYSSSRLNVIDQLLTPGINTVARFHEKDKPAFINLLSEYFASIISRILNDNNEYFKSFRHFIGEVSDTEDNPLSDIRLWHSKFAALSYEYIRGALTTSGRNELLDIRRFNRDIHRICKEALRVNFNAIFGLGTNEYQHLPIIPSETLNELYELGCRYLDADAISDILFRLIAKSSIYPGAVPTDIELAKALAVLVSAYCPTIKDNEYVIDPAAGSGNLLSVFPIFYPNIKPSQLYANDINPYLLQLLSLRLGLKFPSIIKTSNHPKITNQNIADISEDYFKNAKIIVLNPPYLSSTANASNDYKSGIISRIKIIRGDDAISKSQNTPLETAFIELVSLLARETSVIACIVPLSHLYGMGESDILFRKILLSRFGLQCIFRYPQENIFKDVAQNTCILIGKIGQSPQDVVYLSCYDTIDNVDYDSLKNAAFKADFSQTNGIERQIFKRNELEEKIYIGWKILDSVASTAYNFYLNILNNTEKFVVISNNSDLNNSYRGKVGNKGGSNLLFPRIGTPFYTKIQNFTNGHLRDGIRTIGGLDNPYLANCPTRFLDVSNMSDDDIVHIASIYKSTFEKTQAKQVSKTKSVEEYVKLLKSESRFSVSAGSVLLARDCRKSGRAYLAETKTYVSTNVWVFNLNDPKKGRFYHSWFCSIFYQLNCELASKNNAGTRKMDASEFATTIVPLYENFSEKDIQQIIDCTIDSFIVLNNPIARECDIIWAKIISPHNWEEVLNEAIRYLSILATDREA